MKLYKELAKWWPLLSPPEDYAEEAADLLALLRDGAATGQGMTLLELGAGGGSLASHLKQEFQLTLTDISADMLAVSRNVNPECEHLVGDMRLLRLNRLYDRVLIHDAIMYARTAEMLKATLQTAALHCKPGGLVILLPDFVRESFEPDTDTGGHDADDGRGLRFLEWTYDPDPNDNTYDAVYTVVTREPDGSLHVEMDHHIEGLFARSQWLAWLQEAGIPATIHRDPWGRDVFICRKPASAT